jgi:hypothetical protein
MKPMGEETVDSFRQRLLDQRGVIDQVLQGLDLLYPPAANGTHLRITAPAPIVNRARKLKPRKVKAQASAARETNDRQLNPRTVATLQAVGWRLPEEFSAQDAQALRPKGKNKSYISCQMNAWKTRGWIVSIASGQWRKTNKFPENPEGAAEPQPKSQPVECSGPIVPHASLRPPEIHVPRDTPPPAPTTDSGGRVGSVQGLEAADLQLAGKLPAEFKVADLAKLLGDSSPTRAYRWVSEWTRRNWIHGAGNFGVYRKSPKFGN